MCRGHVGNDIYATAEEANAVAQGHVAVLRKVDKYCDLFSSCFARGGLFAAKCGGAGDCDVEVDVWVQARRERRWSGRARPSSSSKRNLTRRRRCLSSRRTWTSSPSKGGGGLNYQPNQALFSLFIDASLCSSTKQQEARPASRVACGSLRQSRRCSTVECGHRVRGANAWRG